MLRASKNATLERVLNQDELKIIDFVIAIGRITSGDVVDILRVPVSDSDFYFNFSFFELLGAKSYSLVKLNV